MPKCIKLFKNKSKAKLYRNRQRRKNYIQTRNGVNSRKKWTDDEFIILNNWTESDRKLSEYIGRSVESIQVQRWKIKVNYVKK